MGKKTIVFIFLWSVSNYVSAQQKVKIACLGNSITFGATVNNPEIQSYPAVLGTLLREYRYQGYEVKNFGIGSATMLHYGKPNLWQELDSVKNYVPDIVIIKAGTNEAVSEPRYNWEHVADFEKDYDEFLKEVRKINPMCEIIICSPLDISLKTKNLSAQRPESLKLWRPRIWKIRKCVQQIAQIHHTYYLDLTKAFKSKIDLITTGDGVHPNVEGYRYLAGLVFNYMRTHKILK